MDSYNPDLVFSSARPLSTEELLQIGYFMDKGLSGRQIATILNRNQSTLCRTIQKYPHKREIQASAKGAQVTPPHLRATPSELSAELPSGFFSHLFSETKLLRRHYLIHILLMNLSSSGRQISEMMAVPNFPFAIGKAQIANDLADMYLH
jgi:hypothetical protein